MEYRADDIEYVAAVPMFAWLPVVLDTGRMAWLRRTGSPIVRISGIR
jgi:hypothetical protein